MYCRNYTSCAPGVLVTGLVSYLMRLSGAGKAWLLVGLVGASQLLASPVQADEGFMLRPYAEGFVAGSGISVGAFDYYPVFAGVSAGFFFHKGIGLELHLDGEILPGEDNDYELAYERGAGVALRLESPAQGGLSGYVLLGYTEFSVRQERENPPVAGDEVNGDFGGPRISIGLVQRLARSPWLSVSAEYRKYYVEGGLDVDAFVLGLRVSQR